MHPLKEWFQPSILLLCALLAVAAAFPIAAGYVNSRDFFFFDIELTSDHAGQTRLFFDLGKGFNEGDSSIQPLAVEPRLKRYRYMIPTGPINRLRLDPIDRPATMTLSRARIIDSVGHVVQEFAPNEIHIEQQIENFEIANNRVRFRVPSGASDPAFIIDLPPKFNLRVGFLQKLQRTKVFGLIVFIIAWLVANLGRLASRPAVSDRFAKLQVRPLRTLAAVSMVAVVIQCYPVLFLGKSFVSPNNGSPFLYESFPSVPGYNETEVEDPKGSDVAALFHCSLYYPSIEREALFNHFELPLWNRYSMCGLPLIGQGTSMFGSLLNFIPLLGNSSAISWDIRYVLTRWLYAFGLSVAVWLLTRHLASAAIVSFVGLFVGFFLFRLNHMAQFSVESSPWILVAWLLLSRAETPRQLLGALTILFFANWETMCSGTVKEAYMLIASFNLAGTLTVLITPSPWSDRFRRMAAAAATGVILLLIGAPLWLIFFDALQTAYTHYEKVQVWQAPYSQIVGVFDDLFYGRLSPNEPHVLPSVNMSILAGAAWAIVRGREVFKNRAIFAMTVVAIGAATIAFDIMPAAWIKKVPFLSQVYHVHNTFSCVLVVILTLLAGTGFHALAKRLTSSGWGADWFKVILVVCAPIALYFWTTYNEVSSPFFQGYMISLILAYIIAIAGMTYWRRVRTPSVLVLAVFGPLALCSWRFGQYLHTPVDAYVLNPHTRVDFRAHSDAVGEVDSRFRGQPSRPSGLGLNVFCGYSEMLGWESIYGVDPIRSRYYDELAVAGGINKLFWGSDETLRSMGGEPGVWHEDNLPLILPMHSLLNIRYYVATHQSPPRTIDGLHFLASHDLDVYENQYAWPRAFMTNAVMPYGTPRALAERLNKATDKRPFAAISASEISPFSFSMKLRGLDDSRLVQPARNYRLTTNKTTFTIDAPTAGVAVLTENYWPEDFRAYINGKRVPYFRVNHAFKGVLINAPGTYDISFEYWPRRMTLSLILCAGGLILGGASVLRLLRKNEV